MSSVYITEPPTSGKVVLHTTYGDIDIELWAKEAPRSCRNFVQLAMEGFFDGMPIHRVIRDLLIQTGDPTSAQGTGTSGEGISSGGTMDDIYGGTVDFLRDVHSRIKFNHRGQVASAGKSGTQFFITLGKAEWLEKKHAIFGKVTGNSIYNVTRISELETDKADRPLELPVITSAEVVICPFDDIVVRPESKKGKENASALLHAAEEEEAKKKTGGGSGGGGGRGGGGGKKAVHLLSFASGGRDGDDDDDDENDVVPKGRRGIISAHEALAKKEGGKGSKSSSGNGMLSSSVGSEDAEYLQQKQQQKQQQQQLQLDASKDDTMTVMSSGKPLLHVPTTSSVSDFAATMRAKVAQRLQQQSTPFLSSSSVSKISKDEDYNEASEERNEAELEASAEQERIRRSQEIASTLLHDGSKTGNKSSSSTSSSSSYNGSSAVAVAVAVAVATATAKQTASTTTTTSTTPSDELLTNLQAMRAKYNARKKVQGNREADTLAKLASFQATLKKTVVEVTQSKNSGSADGESKQTESYHGQILEDSDDDEYREKVTKTSSITTSVSQQTGGIGEADADADADADAEVGLGVSWMANRLKFKHHIDDKYKGLGGGLGERGNEKLGGDDGISSPSSSSGNVKRGGKQADDDDDSDGLLIIDPRLQAVADTTPSIRNNNNNNIRYKNDGDDIDNRQRRERYEHQKRNIDGDDNNSHHRYRHHDGPSSSSSSSSYHHHREQHQLRGSSPPPTTTTTQSRRRRSRSRDDHHHDHDDDDDDRSKRGDCGSSRSRRHHDSDRSRRDDYDSHHRH